MQDAYASAYDLKAFYGTQPGRLLRRLLTGHIRMIWPDIKGLRVAGLGYAPPYLASMQEEAERTVALMPAQGGAHAWPEGKKNLVCLTSELELPLESESVDRLLLIHSLEHTQDPVLMFQECWRVLKGSGRLLVVVPNRMGLWARAEWMPFGHGTPYTAGQVANHLRESLFTPERTESALFMPPFRSFLVLRSAYTFEAFGKFLFPGLAGVLLIEASKQIYAGRGLRKAETARGRRIMVTKPSAV